MLGALQNGFRKWQCVPHHGAVQSVFRHDATLAPRLLRLAPLRPTVLEPHLQHHKKMDLHLLDTMLTTSPRSQSACVHLAPVSAAPNVHLTFLSLTQLRSPFLPFHPLVPSRTPPFVRDHDGRYKLLDECTDHFINTASASRSF